MNGLDRAYQFAFKLAYRLYLLWNFLFRPRSQGVWVAVWCQGELLLIQNSYRRCLTLPGGGIGRGEAPIDAALRELREEVGIGAEAGDLVFWGRYLSRVEYRYDHINLYQLELPSRPEIQLDQREVTWGAFRSPEQALALDLFPTLRRYLEARAAGDAPARHFE